MLSLGKQFDVLSLSFNELCSLFKMCMQISMYLSHWLLHIGLRQQSFLNLSMKELFNNLLFKDYIASTISANIDNCWIKLAPSSIGISFLTTTFRLCERELKIIVGSFNLNKSTLSINQSLFQKGAWN